MEKIKNPIMKQLKMNITIRYTLLLLLFMCNLQLRAQVGAERISNNLFNGTANITVPLVSKSVDGVNASVSLGYHTGGIKMNRIPSSTGLGWEMSTAARITRSIKGKPDEIGYWKRRNDSINGKTLGDVETRVAVANGVLDGESDMFSVVVNGQQVRFMFDCNNHVETFPSNAKLKIERIYNGNLVAQIPDTAYVSLGFKVTDAQGNQFFFAEGNQTQIKFYNYGNTNTTYTYTGYFATDWVIEKVVSYNGREIHYTYERSTYYPVLTGYSQEINIPQIDKDVSLSNGVNTKHCLIKTIEYPDLKVSFDYYGDTGSNYTWPRCDVDGTKALEKITIEGKEDVPPHALTVPALTKRYIWFDMRYFISDTDFHGFNVTEMAYQGGGSPCTGPWSNYNINELRLKLAKIESSYSTTGPKRLLYDFDYYDVADFRGPMAPNRMTHTQDYWGYYKRGDIYATSGITYPSNDPVNIYQSDFVPRDSLGSTAPFFVGVPREADTMNRIFTLKKIKNEAGGVTEFTYGLHSITLGGDTLNLDGLRLDKIKTYDEHHENLTVRETHYTYDDIEWLVPMSAYPNDIKDLFKRKVRFLATPYGPSGPSGPTQIYDDREVISNHSIITNSGSQHGYGKVTVTNKSIYQSANGATPQTYTDVLGSTEHYFSKLKTASSNINVVANILNGSGTYTPLGSNGYVIQNFPPDSVSYLPNASTAAVSTSETDYIFHASPYDEDPFTNRDYALNWAVGLPIKKVSFDPNGQKTKEMEMFYDVHVKALNSDNFLQLSASNATGISEDYGGIVGTNNNASYKSDYYFPLVGKVQVKKTKKKSYLSSTVSKETESELFYNAQGDVERSITKPDLSQPNELVEKKLFYSYDNNHWSSDTAMTQLDQEGITSMVYSEVWKKKPNDSIRLVSASGAGFGQFDGKVRTKNKYSTVLSKPSATYTTGSFNLTGAGTGASIPNFEQSGEISKYDQWGHALEASYKGLYSATIYDEDLDLALASINNARHSEVAYSGFESTTYGSDTLAPNYLSRNKGNWCFDHSKVSSLPTAHTGLMSYDYSVGNGIWSGADVSLIPGKKYVLTYWIYGNPWLGVLNGTFDASGNSTGSSVALGHTQIRSVNGWKLFRIEFEAVHPGVQLHGIGISGTGIIDEVRLHPLDAQMTTKSIKPLLGVTTVSDGNNRTVRYEYDEWGRLLLTKDDEGNILSKKKYGVQAND